MMITLVADAPIDALGTLPAEAGIALVEPGAAIPADTEFLVLEPALRDRLAEALPGLPALRIVQTIHAGVDWVPPLPESVTLCNARGVHDRPVAEWIVGAILAMGKRLPHYWSLKSWDHSGNLSFGDGPAPLYLGESTVLIVGYGSIGARLEECLAPFGCRVLRVASRARDGGVHGPEALPELLGQADVVVLLAPATAATRGLVDEAFLSAMRPGALLVNAARGVLVETGALVKALHGGHVRAALDATDPEPLPDGHPLWSAPDVLITPHVAGSSASWRQRAYRLAGAQIRAYAAGQALRNVLKGPR